ncbi:MAG TPA: phosphatidate cytidylyltransferase [Kiloniellales bacterium]
MAQWPARVDTTRKRVRVASAVVIAPPVLAAIYFGSPYMEIFVLATGAIVAWEWARLCGGGRLDRLGWTAVAAVVAALFAGGLGRYVEAAAIAGLVALGIAPMLVQRRSPAAVWLPGGIVYLTAAGLGLLFLRDRADDGWQIILWLLAVVWATDTGGFVAGRTLGGPKLAPTISPNKTWSGLAGAMVAAAAVGAVAGSLWPGRDSVTLALASLGLALVAQAGDLLESRLKRRFGAKDSSHLIPGHGGLLDRVDGVLSVGLVVSVIFWWTGR